MVKNNIHIVDLNQHSTDVPQPTEESNENTDEVSMIKQEIKKEEESNNIIVKEKPKRSKKVKEETNITEKPKRSKKVIKTEIPVETEIEIEEEVKPIEEEKPIVEEKPKKETKTKVVELIKCPDCGKDVNKKTLRYSHQKTCNKGVPREDIPVKRRATEEKKKEEVINITKDVIEEEINKRINNQREIKIKQKEEKIKKLASKIF